MKGKKPKYTKTRVLAFSFLLILLLLFGIFLIKKTTLIEQLNDKLLNIKGSISPPDFQGVVPFTPKEPGIPRPISFSYCENDQDCTITVFRIDSCCTFCEYAVNKIGERYLEELDKLNCQKFYSMKNCITFECSDINKSTIRCENSACIVNYIR